MTRKFQYVLQKGGGVWVYTDGVRAHGRSASTGEASLSYRELEASWGYIAIFSLKRRTKR